MNNAIQALTLEKIESVIDRYFGFRLKRAQVDALHHLLCDKMDLILIAKTGFGKSILFQAAPLMFSPCKSVLIIMPLIALKEEQCEKVTLIDNCRPIVLNGDVMELPRTLPCFLIGLVFNRLSCRETCPAWL